MTRNTKKECVLTIYFDIRKYFEVSVFEIKKANYKYKYIYTFYTVKTSSVKKCQVLNSFTYVCLKS